MTLKERFEAKSCGSSIIINGKTKAMSGGLPTAAAIILLKGCIAPIHSDDVTRYVSIPIGNGQQRFVKNRKAYMINYLYSEELVLFANTRARITHFHLKNNTIPSDRSRLFTSPKGVRLLMEWSKRKSFKPFFDAYAGHITNTMLDAQKVMSKLDSERMIPIWIKDRESLEPRDKSIVTQRLSRRLRTAPF